MGALKRLLLEEKLPRKRVMRCLWTQNKVINKAKRVIKHLIRHAWRATFPSRGRLNFYFSFLGSLIIPAR